MAAPDERQDEIASLQAELADWQERSRRLEAVLEGRRLRDQNRFWNGLLHGDLDTLDRVKAAQQEVQECQRNITRIERRLSALGAGPPTTPRREDEAPWHSAERSKLAGKVARAKRARRSATKLVRSIRSARRRINRAARLQAGGEKSRSEANQAAKVAARRIRQVQKRVAELRSDLPPELPANLDGVAALNDRFSRDDEARSREYKDARAALDSLLKEVTPLRDKLKSRVNSARAELSRLDKKDR